MTEHPREEEEVDAIDLLCALLAISPDDAASVRNDAATKADPPEVTKK